MYYKNRFKQFNIGYKTENFEINYSACYTFAWNDKITDDEILAHQDMLDTGAGYFTSNKYEPVPIDFTSHKNNYGKMEDQWVCNGISKLKSQNFHFSIVVYVKRLKRDQFTRVTYIWIHASLIQNQANSSHCLNMQSQFNQIGAYHSSGYVLSTLCKIIKSYDHMGMINVIDTQEPSTCSVKTCFT